MARAASLERSGDELRGLARLTFSELADAVRGLEQLHQAIAGRAFAGTGAMARPTQLAHDAIAGGVYRGLRGAALMIGRAAEAAAAQRPEPHPHALSRRPAGSAVLGALNGLIGDRIERELPELHQPMSVRVHGELVPPKREALAAAFPAATAHVVVFVHGLMGTEYTWWIGARERGTYGGRLQDELDVTPVYVRYNTGRHISENGRSLAELMEALVGDWPVPVERLSLVGHSMGGLVVRSACHVAAEERAEWVRTVRHVVSLGTPHMGAPLAQGVHYASAALAAVPETRPLAGLLRRRSAGIRDLRQGSLVDADWRDRDPDTLRAVVCEEVPLLEDATHCFIAATITHSARHPVGRMVGDVLVLEPSASGRSRTRRIPFLEEYGTHLGSTHHIALLNHPRVYEKLREWIGAD